MAGLMRSGGTNRKPMKQWVNFNSISGLPCFVLLQFIAGFMLLVLSPPMAVNAREHIAFPQEPITGLSNTEQNAEEYAISGRVRFTGSYDIYVSVVDGERFASQKGEIAHLIIAPTAEEQGRGEVAFRFKRMPAGVYGIMVFQDQKRDGKLNIGRFGPVEPWGMSFQNSRPRLRPPRFGDIKFELTKNMDVGVIIVE